MKKRILTLILVLAVLVGLMADLSTQAAVTSSENETVVYRYLKDELGLNTAAACGVMANIKAECGFNPTAYNSAGYYGLCQWGGGRLTNLKNYCSSAGYDYTSAAGQLAFIAHELEGSYSSVLTKLLAVDNTADGAYDAGYIWARYYEACYSGYYATRAESARDTFWPEYNCQHKWKAVNIQIEHPHYTDEVCELCGEYRTNLESTNYVEQCDLCNLRGDLNGDGVRTLEDVSLLFRYISGEGEIDEQYLSRIYINNDELVNLIDLTLLYRMVTES